MDSIYDYIKQNKGTLPNNILGIEYEAEPSPLNSLNIDQINTIHGLTRLFEEDAATNFKNYKDSIRVNRYPLLDGKRVYLLFEKESTRTIGSFEIAAESLGATVKPKDLTRSSMAKGESLTDTFHMYQDDYGADMIVYRGDVDLRNVDLSDIEIPIINAGDMNEHPTQAILDSYVLIKEANINDVKNLNLKVMFVGHTRGYRAAQSLSLLLNYTNCDITNLFPSSGHPMDAKWLYACNPHPFLHLAKPSREYCLGEYPYPSEKDIDTKEYFLDPKVPEIVDGNKLIRARNDRRDYLHTLSELISDKDILYICRPTIEGEQAIIRGLTPDFIGRHAKQTMKIMHPLPRDKNRHELDKGFDGTARDLYRISQPQAGVRTRQALLALMV